MHGRKDGRPLARAFHRWLLRGGCFFVAILLSTGLTTEARVRVLSNAEPRVVFSGDGREIPVVLQNDGTNAEKLDLHFRLHQATSATTVLLKQARWKELQVLPGQTILETVALDLPHATGETTFLIQWLNGTNQVLGRTQIRAFPPDLLKGLKPLLGDAPLGVFDPGNQLRPLLQKVGIEVFDLDDSNVETFPGKLAIIGPFVSRDLVRTSLFAELKAQARKNVGVVWIYPPRENNERPVASIYQIPEGSGLLLVVQNSEIADLPRSPQAQLRLVYLAQVAMRSTPFPLPELNLTTQE